MKRLRAMAMMAACGLALGAAPGGWAQETGEPDPLPELPESGERPQTPERDGNPLEVTVTPLDMDVPDPDEFLARETIMPDGTVITLGEWIRAHYFTGWTDHPASDLELAVQTGASVRMLTGGRFAFLLDHNRDGAFTETERMAQLGTRFVNLSLADVYATFGRLPGGEQMGAAMAPYSGDMGRPVALGDDGGAAIDNYLLMRRSQPVTVDSGLGQLYLPSIGGYNPIFGLGWAAGLIGDALPDRADDSATDGATGGDGASGDRGSP
ncbi:hypothetical protein CCR85_06835 [Rhodothalassium salexigens]|uniref:hypothetical protein n=1 Tax=Rhodothalassium salexigens TaxID=1086 RepID=UPI001912B10C|nr:hypothetical protein [Rhodothalassium salexigens]MBK5911207.1 hypothetical protein [Rhodothalassium salexigens]MBK5919895.1 hypothetical protein [Rhodothalassium salexigens]